MTNKTERKKETQRQKERGGGKRTKKVAKQKSVCVCVREKKKGLRAKERMREWSVRGSA